MSKFALLKRLTGWGLGMESPAAGGCRGVGAKPPAAGQVFVIFWKKELFYGAIRKIRSYLTNKHLHILYYSMIYSHINYCLTTWFHGNKVIANKIQKVCKNSIACLIVTSPPKKQQKHIKS